MCDFLDFGFPIGYLGNVKHDNSAPVNFIKNQKGAIFSPKIGQAVSEESDLKITRFYTCI